MSHNIRDKIPLHQKKKLNEQLYRLQLECANKWQALWPIIIQSIDDKLGKEMKTQYQNLNQKLYKLQKQTNKENKIPHQHTQFHDRTANLTNIEPTQEETMLLNKGMQHSIERPLNTYWTTLITETEQAIRKLHSKIQESYRILAAKKLKQIKKAECQQNTTAKREFYTVNKLKEKLVKENSMIVKTDKGRTSVIIYTEVYNKNVNGFIKENNFEIIPKDPTE